MTPSRSMFALIFQSIIVCDRDRQLFGYEALMRAEDKGQTILPAQLLDTELMRGVHADLYRATLVAKILEMARALGIKSVAEGIECSEEFAWMAAHGAYLAQGFYISRPTASPLPAPDLNEKPQARRTNTI